MNKKQKLMGCLVVLLITIITFSSCSGNITTKNGATKDQTGTTVANTTAVSDKTKLNDNNEVALYSDVPYYGLASIYLDVYTDGFDKYVTEYNKNLRVASDDKSYTIYDCNDGVCIAQYIGNEENVVIPDVLDNKPVVKISGYFKNYQESGNYCYRSAFDMSKIKSITISSQVKEISFNEFHTDWQYSESDSDKDVLEQINVSKNNPYYSSENGLLYNKDKSVLLCVPYNYNSNTISFDSNTKIAYEMISKNTKTLNIPANLEKISEIPSSVTPDDTDKIINIDEINNTYPLRVVDCQKSLENITVDSENKFFSSEDGVLYNKNKTELILYPYHKSGVEFSVPETVTVVGDFVLSDVQELSSITFGKNILQINAKFIHPAEDVWTQPALTTVKGYKNTEVEKWANENELEFVALD